MNVNNNEINPIAMPNDPPEYTTLISNSKKITSELRFETGKQSLDSRGVADILRLVKFMTEPENAGKKVILVGFTDNTGDNKKNLSLSIQRANVVKTILEASGISVKKTMGFGSARPVRSNLTEEDRANNRRVELWLAN
jgi:phosphate transport system substrate-binding protein